MTIFVTNFVAAHCGSLFYTPSGVLRQYPGSGSPEHRGAVLDEWPIWSLPCPP